MSGSFVGEYLRSPGSHECDRRTNGSIHPGSTPDPFLHASLDLIHDAALPALADPGGTNRDSFGESGPPLPPLSKDTNHPFKPLLVSDSNTQALQRLVIRVVSKDELPFVIESIFSNVRTVDIVRCLEGSDAQAFIDVIDEVCYHTVVSLSAELVH